MIALNEITRQFPNELQRPEFFDIMVKEYLHHYMLKTLFTQKTSGKLAFLGGTALRYFYGLNRFSEDLDFDCLNLTKEQFLEITTKVQYDLLALGYNVVIEDKLKYLELKAFRRVFVFPELKYKMGISPHKESKFFLKIEAESQNAEYEADIKTLIGFIIFFHHQWQYKPAWMFHIIHIITITFHPVFHIG